MSTSTIPLTGRIKFTVKAVESLIPPKSGRAVVHDSETKGLCLQLLPDRSKAWYFYGRIEGRPSRMKLGEWPAMAVESAREKVLAIRASLTDGVDPRAARRSIRTDMTFGELWQWYFDTFSRPRKRSWRDDLNRWNRILKKLAQRPLRSIRRDELISLHTKIGATAPTEANRVLALISVMFAKARQIGYVGDNPAKGIEHFKEKSRDRFLAGDEIRRFFDVLAAQPQHWQDFFALALWTGARAGNVRSMKWHDVDLETALWTIPGEVAKAGEPIRVTLPVQAVTQEVAGDVDAPQDMHGIVVAAVAAMAPHRLQQRFVGDQVQQMFQGDQIDTAGQFVPGEQGVGGEDTHGSDSFPFEQPNGRHSTSQQMPASRGRRGKNRRIFVVGLRRGSERGLDAGITFPCYGLSLRPRRAENDKATGSLPTARRRPALACRILLIYNGLA